MYVSKAACIFHPSILRWSPAHPVLLGAVSALDPVLKSPHYVAITKPKLLGPLCLCHSTETVHGDRQREGCKGGEINRETERKTTHWETKGNRTHYTQEQGLNLKEIKSEQRRREKRLRGKER